MYSRIGDLNLKTNPIVPKTFLISFSFYRSYTCSELYMEECSCFDEVVLCKTWPETS